MISTAVTIEDEPNLKTFLNVIFSTLVHILNHEQLLSKHCELLQHCFYYIPTPYSDSFTIKHQHTCHLSWSSSLALASLVVKSSSP